MFEIQRRPCATLSIALGLTICEIMGGSMGSFGCKLYLVVYLFACFIESNNVLCQASFIYLLCSVSFPIRFHAQCSVHNANLFSAVYQACTKPSLKCYLHWFSARSAYYIIKHIILLVLIVCPFTVYQFLYSLNYILFLLVSSVLSYYHYCSHLCSLLALRSLCSLCSSASVFSLSCLIFTAALH